MRGILIQVASNARDWLLVRHACPLCLNKKKNISSDTTHFLKLKMKNKFKILFQATGYLQSDPKTHQTDISFNVGKVKVEQDSRNQWQLHAEMS